MTRSTLRSALGALALTGAVAVAAPAHASHYRIVDISERFSAEALAEFSRLGYATTLDVLRNVSTPDARAALASVSGVTVGELTEVARMCEFLQIEGIGPKAFQLLVAAGVQDVEDLAGREAASLLAELIAVNATQRITGVDPEVELVRHWIIEAAQAPIRVIY